MTGVVRGAAVAIDPRDGSILGMVSRPAFDPNEFSVGLSSKRWKELSGGGLNPLLNRAIQGQYPPGSTFKIVSMLAALEAGLVRSDTHLQPCMGSYMFGGRSFGCWKRTGHGSLDFVAALQHSCDVYFYQIGPRLGLEKLGAAARAFGGGAPTGLDLPQEGRGLVPDLAWYSDRGRTWRESLMLNLIIGQGEFLMTPLQIALMTAEVAVEGRPLRPHVLRSVEDGDSPRLELPTHTGFSADPATWAAVHRALELVVSDGTARSAQVTGVRVAGKTGTAENPHGEDHALFVCYAPADAPRIAMAYVIENGGHGGSAAAPRAGLALRRLFLPDSLQRPFVPPRPAAPAPVVAPDSTLAVLDE
jgi:penicillin-binding protein 2